MLMLCSLFVTFLLLVSEASPSLNLAPFSDELVDHLNNKPGMTWRAAKSRRFKSMAEFRQVLGALKEPLELKRTRRPTIDHSSNQEALPVNFDSREKWPQCNSIRHIWDQSSCGSCWAFGAANAMTDRMCIHKKTEIYISPTDLLSCCRGCGFGCQGGYLGPAWDFWRDKGVVTGGDYGDNSTCWPYPFPPCDHTRNLGENKYDKCPKELYPTPRCRGFCVENAIQRYYEDKIWAKSSYNIAAKEEAIMEEVYQNGPVEVAFDVYEDFGMYDGGIYQYTWGQLAGGHAVRLLGWGVENDVKYWLLANSWNPEWATNGTFRFIRGINDCGIESNVVAGIPA